MRTVAITLISLLVFCQMGSSQSITSKIVGQVVDQVTSQPLIGAEVFILIDSTVIGSVTDLDGRFLLSNVPVGRHAVYARYLGFEDLARNNVLVTTGVAKELILPMVESIAALEGVEVVAKKNRAETVNASALVSTRSFSVEEASRFAGSFNDPARMAQSFAGVVNGNDENNEIIIRGNSPRGVLWRLEGLEIPNPNHYRSGEGGSGGAISMITDQVLANSDFFTGAFPGEYGNALSGVFDLRFRNGSTDERKISLQAGVLGLQVGAEGPMGADKKASYLINYRYSTVTILEKIGINFTDENEITPVFQDLSFKLNFPGKGGNRWTVYGLGGRSIAGSDPVRDSTQWNQFDDRVHFDETYTTGILGVSNNTIFKNQKTSLHTVASVNYQADLYEDYIIQEDYRDQLWEDSEFSYLDFRLASNLSHKFSSAFSLKTGIKLNQLGYSILQTDWLEDTENDYETVLDDDGSALFTQVYAQALLRPSENLTINGGLHAGYFTLNGQTLLEPRLSLQYQLTDRSSLQAGLGLHSRLEPVSLYLAKDELDDGTLVQRNKDLGLTKALHIVAGYEFLPTPDWRLKIEGYYQSLSDVPVFDDGDFKISSLNFSSGFTNVQLVNQGLGRNYGGEVTVEKFLSNGTFFLFTTSIFESQYQITEDQPWLDTRYNLNYLFNALGGKEWNIGKEKNNLFSVNGRLIYHGGPRIIPVNFDQSQAEGRTIRNTESGYSTQFDPFFRIDLSAAYRKNKEKLSWQISLDLQNALNRQNVLSAFYSLRRNAYQEFYQLPLLPVLNYRIEF